MIWKLYPSIVNKSEIKLFILIILLFLPSQTFPQSTDQIEFVSNEKLQEGLWLQHNWNYMFEEDTSKRNIYRKRVGKERFGYIKK
jgi:hypothetical protein